jgi:hypothetical protein
MEVVGWWAGEKEGELPTSLDFSTNSGWNSVPLLLVSLIHTERPFRVSLVVSKLCKMSLGQKFPKLCFGKVSPSIVNSKLNLIQQPPIQICQDLYQLPISMPYML